MFVARGFIDRKVEIALKSFHLDYYLDKSIDLVLWFSLSLSLYLFTFLVFFILFSLFIQILRNSKCEVMDKEQQLLFCRYLKILSPKKKKIFLIAVNVLLSLISLLSGRYWTGKERLPEAISSLFRAVPDMLRLELTPQQQIEVSLDLTQITINSVLYWKRHSMVKS